MSDSEEQKQKWLRMMHLQTPVRFSETVQSALDSVADPEDPFNKPDFCVISYINHLFPTEPRHIGQVMADVQRQINQVDQEISEILERQSVAQLDSEALLQQTKQAMRELFAQIMDIKRQTDMSETTVKEITRDIRQLDLAKKNLTASITTLNHLHMLVSGLESLESFVKTKNFRDISNLLPGIQNVLEHFSQYMTVPQIKALSDQVNSIRAELADLTTAELKRYFSGGFKKASGQQSVPIGDVCLVLSVLDQEVRDGLIGWLIDQQLAEYKILFDDTQDDAWLDKIDLRFSWFRDCLIEFERKHAVLLPAEWDVACKFAAEFFQLTGSMLDQVMEKRSVELDAKLLLFAVQRAANFEALMARRFPGRGEALFQGTLVGRFQKRMSIYTASLDKTLNDLIDQLVGKFKEVGPPSAEYGSAAVAIPTSSDLFVFYKKCIQQLLQLGMNANILVDLSRLFKKYLHEYAQRCLTGVLPKIASSHSTTTAGLLQSFLKEGDMPRLSNDEIYLVCCVLITAEFCAETSHQLQEKLKEKAGDLALHEAFDFTSEREMFHGVVSSCVQVLVQDLESACEPALQTMTKMQWANVDSVGDESRYVASIRQHGRQCVVRIRDCLGQARKYFMQFCFRFVNAFVPKFINAILRCRPVSVTGAEQLLLDTHALKTELVNLPVLESAAGRKPPEAFTKLVIKGMTKAEMILKLVMAPVDEPGTFVEHYINFLPESDVVEFQKILDMKSVRKNEQTTIMDIFREKKAALDSNNDLSADGGVASGDAVLSSGDNSNLDSRIRKLEKLNDDELCKSQKDLTSTCCSLGCFRRRLEIQKQFTCYLLTFYSASTVMDSALCMDTISKALYQTIHSYIAHNDIVSYGDWHRFRTLLLESSEKQNAVDCAVLKVLQKNCYFDLGMFFINFLFDTGLHNPITIKQAVYFLEQCYLKSFENFDSRAAKQLLHHILVMEKSFPNFFTYEKAIVLCLFGDFGKVSSMWSSVLDCLTKCRLMNTVFIAACRHRCISWISRLTVDCPFTLSALCHVEMAKSLEEMVLKNRELSSKFTLDQYVDLYDRSRCFTFDESAVESFKNYFASFTEIEWTVDCGIVTEKFCCSCCGNALKQMALSDEEFKSLKDDVFKRIVFGEDPSRQTTIEELIHFQQFLNKNGPFDVVVDGCNIAYLGGPASSDVQIRRITRLVRVLRFELNFKNILVVGREHFMRFAPDSLRTMAKLFSVPDLTTDDVYVIAAAMNSGNHCYVVSNVMLQKHFYRLVYLNQDYFCRWRDMRQIFCEKIEPNCTRSEVLKIPIPLCNNVERNYYDGSYHFLYVPNKADEFDHRHLKNVMCVRKLYDYR
ncbi:Vacuolar protein sorting-associated protein 53 -like protein [Trichinella pseudospiralis]|uniref:Vacuolar protein sorting-associated protein 53 homolog n=1 Tax=Trichinella pseudospiralis TaxID=6337 RepID=A0A0V1K7D3_TRIPS|nr:Vacuolar protein sorting-associated protein 53 -like protein [Trichinella pseudospiralis]